MGWLIVFYDLPFKTKKQRKAYAQFRKLLLEDGYSMMQLSVYIRPCVSRERMETHAKRIESFLPPAGSIRCLFVTNSQWEKMLVFKGEEVLEREEAEQLPQQLLLW